MKQSMLDAMGGLAVMERIHTAFYDKVYAHPWLGKFFEGHNQRAIELRQTQFMAEKMGGDVPYPGKALPLVHRHMYITEELLEVRQGLLREAIEEEGLSAPLVERWLRIDHAFWRKIKNNSFSVFKQTDFKYEKPVVIEKP